MWPSNVKWRTLRQKANLIFKNKISVKVFFSILQEHIPIQDEPEKKWKSLLRDLRRMLQESQEINIDVSILLSSKSSIPLSSGKYLFGTWTGSTRKDTH